jgi:hypothetical protein
MRDHMTPVPTKPNTLNDTFEQFMQMRGLDAFFEADTCSANLATL